MWGKVRKITEILRNTKVRMNVFKKNEKKFG